MMMKAACLVWAGALPGAVEKSGQSDFGIGRIRAVKWCRPVDRTFTDAMADSKILKVSMEIL